TVTADKATATFTVPATAQGEEVRIVATNTYTPVDVPTPKVATTARAVSGEADNGKTLKPGEDATIEDTLAWENLPAGDYVLVPTLQTKGDHGITATPGQKAEPVTFTVEQGQKQGEVKATIVVPSTQVAPHTTFVVFEKVYRAADTTRGVPVECTTPVATLENPDVEGQTVTVDKPTPVTPTVCGDITPDTPDEDKPEECRPEVSST